MAVVYYTSDTHSYLYPEDHKGRTGLPMGCALLYSGFGDADLTIDGGDVLQGSPLARYELKRGVSPLTAARLFNLAPLDVYVPGNHDFNFGPRVLASFLSSLDAEVVCANLEDSKWGMPVRPYTVRTLRDGVRVLVCGVVTDFVNVWERPSNLDGLRVTDCVEAARRVLEESASLDVDFRILVYHGGFDDTALGGLRENRGAELCALGYDLALTAHQHAVIPPRRVGASLTLQAGANGERAARITLEKGRPPEAVLVAPSLEAGIRPDFKALLYGDAKARLDSYLRGVAGYVDGVLEDRSKLHSALWGSSLADFINCLQLKATGAEVSACALFNNPVSLQGRVPMRDVLAAYPFSNTLAELRIDGAILKEALERSASYLCLQDGTPAIDKSFSPGKVQHYNYDFYRGIAYTYDLDRPVGDRVTRLVLGGRDLLREPGTPLTIALNSYRATGTGGYEAYLRGKTLRRLSTEVQDLILDELERRKVVPPPPTDFAVVWRDGGRICKTGGQTL